MFSYLFIIFHFLLSFPLFPYFTFMCLFLTPSPSLPFSLLLLHVISDAHASPGSCLKDFHHICCGGEKKKRSKRKKKNKHKRSSSSRVRAIIWAIFIFIFFGPETNDEYLLQSYQSAVSMFIYYREVVYMCSMCFALYIVSRLEVLNGVMLSYTDMWRSGLCIDPHRLIDFIWDGWVR